MFINMYFLSKNFVQSFSKQLYTTPCVIETIAIIAKKTSNFYIEFFFEENNLFLNLKFKIDFEHYYYYFLASHDLNIHKKL